jgi:hypothetical protein
VGLHGEELEARVDVVDERAPVQAPNLGTMTASVNSALQRARANIVREGDPRPVIAALAAG